ncbi:MAG: bifunctional phosphopantothenoylcysteine decarboxylase/phosphopantothenate--cysteine ligase CoaBC [Thermodesulfovibrionales bacterium]|nr:bifunctional phosphopantothenoylcysteine decarboxylase/phosphopantothenate--cysteine ligase CoaBC [Thermodesulfovibrionales bacterium]MDP3110760.1 bifunctional phosphopantothenoylcysteine decarboxylase/phosphopantothenate--cysteine ligase CoaBC [Thermodesulfovibrionales bacterium]
MAINKKKVLKNKKILLGVTGGVAAYKAVDLIRRLKDDGASVTVIMTDASKNFITPLSLQIASGNKVYSGLFEDPMSHIELSRDADLMLIAPATANIIGKFANGIADDLLSTCILSFRGKVVIAPSMNWRMYENPMVRGNLKRLTAHGILQVGPDKGTLACGEEGVGRMADVNEIIEAVKSALSKKDLSKKKVIVTGGPTREYLDPVRFISNRSSGKMGYAVAGECIRRGAEVILISGPSALQAPRGLKAFVKVETAGEMREAVFKNLSKTDIVIMAAAPADFLPEKKEKIKIDKSEKLSIKFKNTPDILAEIGKLKKRPLLVGFAAETGKRLDRARAKRMRKGADIIVFNDVTEAGSGFDVDTNKITIIGKDREKPLPMMTKHEASEAILDVVSECLRK